tara:strand:+ start:328 stop:732 length:405 start_codon:yes stop_codon:yes gene_type:complete
MEEFRRDSDTLKEDNINRNEAAADFDQLFTMIINLHAKWGSEFDDYQQDLYIDRKWTLQTLEDFIGSWYNNYNADVKSANTRENKLEAVYKEVEATMPDDGVAKPDVLNGLQETMIMLSYQAKISDKIKEWYRG